MALFTVTERFDSAGARDPELRTLAAYAEKAQKTGILEDLVADKSERGYEVSIKFKFIDPTYRIMGGKNETIGQALRLLQLAMGLYEAGLDTHKTKAK